MKRAKYGIFALLVFCNILLLTGCWNYREIDEMAVVGGVAVDKGTTKRYKITVEIMHIEGGREAKTDSRVITMEGDSMFDTVRNMISQSGEKLYWSHAKVIIISQELAKTGVAKIIDWYSRDAETRDDVYILISGEPTAGEIFDSETPTEALKSMEFEMIIDNQKNISKAPQTEIWDFINKISGEGVEPTAPVIFLEKDIGKKTAKTEGTAVFKHDRFMGFLGEEDTKDMLFIQNQIKGGILTQTEMGKDGEGVISLEIFGNHTKIEPVLKDGEIEINIKTETEVALDEIGVSEDFIDEAGKKKLEGDMEKTLQTRMENVIKKVQSEYGVDIFGFGAKVRQSKPDLWDRIGDSWDSIFKDLKVNVGTKIHIRNSAVTSKVIEVGD